MLKSSVISVWVYTGKLILIIFLNDHLNCAIFLIRHSYCSKVISFNCFRNSLRKCFHNLI